MVLAYQPFYIHGVQTRESRGAGRDIEQYFETGRLKMMRITAIIEKGSDGMFSVRSEQKIGKHYFGGFGESVAIAKEDFLESVREVIEEAREEGIKVPDTFQVTYRFDIPSFFNFFDYLNVSKFAELAGINESKMRQYKCGSAYPGEKVTKRITSAIRKIASDFSSASL
jgi:hypothetical protein